MPTVELLALLCHEGGVGGIVFRAGLDLLGELNLNREVAKEIRLLIE